MILFKYVELEHEKDPDDEENQNKEVKAINKMLIQCEKTYGEEVAMRFRRILEDLGKVQSQFQCIFKFFVALL